MSAMDVSKSARELPDEPLVLSVEALRCRVANAKYLHNRVDECIKETSYSRYRPSVFFNEEREVLMGIGQDLELIYDTLIGVLMNAPKRGASHYAVSFGVEERLNGIRLHLLNMCQSASLMDNLSQNTRATVDAIINFAEPNEEARSSPREHSLGDENIPPGVQEPAACPAAVAAAADGPKSSRASLPREVSCSSFDSPCKRLAAPGCLDRRHSLPNDAGFTVWPASPRPTTSNVELPFGLPSDKQQHLGGVDSPKSGAAEPQLSALNLRRHNQQMAAERELGEVCGRARRQLSLDPLALGTGTKPASACPDAATATCPSFAHRRTHHSAHTCVTCGHTHPHSSLPHMPALDTRPARGCHGRAAAVAAFAVAALAAAVVTLATNPSVRSRLENILPDRDDPRVRRRRQPGCFESDTPRLPRMW